jgi:hypothetical protein
MNKILYIGGVASNPRQIDSVVRVLSAHYGTGVAGMSFSEAQKDRALVARLANDCLVITHSAGIIMLRSCTPKEVIAIAPPMPVSVPVLLFRGIPNTVSLIRGANESHERRQKVVRHFTSTFGEHIIRPLYNSIQLGQISKFNIAEEAVTMVTNGVKVTLGFMQDERLFLRSATHPYIDVAKKYGVVVHDDIIGHHDEFLLFPLDVLAQIKRL